MDEQSISTTLEELRGMAIGNAMIVIPAIENRAACELRGISLPSLSEPVTVFRVPGGWTFDGQFFRDPDS